METFVICHTRSIKIDIDMETKSVNQWQLNYLILSILADTASGERLTFSFFKLMTEKIHHAVQELAGVYGDIVPRIHEFRKFIKVIPTGDFFLLHENQKWTDTITLLLSIPLIV